jgi:hypothetical protein
MDVSNLFVNQKNDPVVVNFAQNLEFTGNFLVGRLLPKEELPEDVAKNPWPKQKNGVSKEIVYWEAIDAETADRNNQLQETPILSDNLMTIGPGVVSPRKVFVLMPDSLDEIPDEFLRPTNSANPEIVEKVGSFFAQFFRHRRLEKSLRIVAEAEPEMYEKIENLVKNSSLDDDVRMKQIRELEQLREMADDRGNSNSDS